MLVECQSGYGLQCAGNDSHPGKSYQDQFTKIAVNAAGCLWSARGNEIPKLRDYDDEGSQYDGDTPQSHHFSLIRCAHGRCIRDQSCLTRRIYHGTRSHVAAIFDMASLSKQVPIQDAKERQEQFFFAKLGVLLDKFICDRAEVNMAA